MLSLLTLYGYIVTIGITSSIVNMVNILPVVETGWRGYRISVVAHVSLPPHKFVRPPLCYYQLQETKKNKKLRIRIGLQLHNVNITFHQNPIRLFSSGRVKIYTGSDTKGKTGLCALISCSVCRENIIIKES
jgi:hypothetical protein